MSQIRICDECDQPIEDGTDFMAGSVSPMTYAENGQLIQGEVSQLDWHVEHFPVAVRSAHDG